MNNTVWNKMDKEELKALYAFNEDYRQFLSASKTERTFVTNSIKLAEEAGFRPLESFEELKAGDRVYVNNRGKNLCLFVIGTEPVKNGLNILGAHIDSPRMDLKQHPLYEKDGLALFDTHTPAATQLIYTAKDSSSTKLTDDFKVGVATNGKIYTNGAYATCSKGDTYKFKITDGWYICFKVDTVGTSAATNKWVISVTTS